MQAGTGEEAETISRAEFPPPPPYYKQFTNYNPSFAFRQDEEESDDEGESEKKATDAQNGNGQAHQNLPDSALWDPPDPPSSDSFNCFGVDYSVRSDFSKKKKK